MKWVKKYFVMSPTKDMVQEVTSISHKVGDVKSGLIVPPDLKEVNTSKDSTMRKSVTISMTS